MAILASPSTIQNLGYHGDGNSAPSSFTPASLYPTSHKHCRKIVWKCLRVERPLLRIPQARSVGDRCRRGARRGEYWREMQRGSARKREHDRCRGSARQRDEVSVLEESMEGDYNEGDKRIFIFGMGYTSLALANGLKKKNWTVSGTCRTDEKRAALEDCGFQAFFFNPDNDGEHLQDYAVRELYAATYVLSSIPPVGDLDEDPVLASHRYELSQAATQGKLCWIGFLSSTGIYGDWHGNWVDEDTEPQPVERRAVARFTAEKAWLELGETIGVGVHIFSLRRDLWAWQKLIAST